ncbi:flavin-binding monooxygenase [Talaromyces proteolyticus]|uniref:Flavin-binding monooxygenase n=1 Tax=Talaromyces proteolyticus TaxID=1131652 RepID=A0AAD4KR98_9EURO|nr:flavin-binding monooxygenase [Talaromyces proteolyticus]KAH8697526.1 flavin-binding monooxygenase [Talaromyces proteolyticus]
MNEEINSILDRYGIPKESQFGGNRRGPHPASVNRPVHYPEWDEKPSDRGYVVSNHMINEPPERPFRIVVIGAGAAGIDFLHHAPKQLGDLGVEIVCYEKNPDVGGTWYENRYPGCACDVPSVSYSFPWKQNPNWRKFYSTSKEIWEYMKSIVDEEGMMKYIQLQCKIVSANWNDERSKWNVRVRRQYPGKDSSFEEWSEECDMILNGGGFLNDWKWPKIPGIKTFTGDLFHTAGFQEGYDLKDKTVAVIGAGSSGIQTVSAVYPEVKKLYTWVRSATWITAAIGQKFASKDGRNFAYTPEQRELFERSPETYHRYHKMIEHELNNRFRTVLRNSAESEEANAFAYNEMTAKLKTKPDILEAMLPRDFSVGCRRPTPDNGYLGALVGEKTKVLPGSIKSITEKGVVAEDGTEYPVDVIICATGFDTSFRPRFPIFGLNPDLPLAEKWAKIPASYLGISVDGFPNYFTYGGPFTPVAQGSVLPILSLLSKYFITVIKTMRVQHIRRLSPKPSAVEDFLEHTKTYLPRTVWADPCTSWFKQGTKDGDLIMWPGSRLSFFEALREPYLQDYDIEYFSRNRFGYLGSGFVDFEFKSPLENTWYLDEFSGRKEWKRDGVPYYQDPSEFEGLSEGILPSREIN